MNAPEAALYGQCVYMVLMHTNLQVGAPYHQSCLQRAIRFPTFPIYLGSLTHKLLLVQED